MGDMMNVADVQARYCCGKTQAYQIMRKAKQVCLERNYYFNSRYVPTEIINELFKIKKR